MPPLGPALGPALLLALLWAPGAVGRPTASPWGRPPPCGRCLGAMVGLGALGGAFVVAGGLLCQRLLGGRPPAPPDLWVVPPPWGEEAPEAPAGAGGPPQPHVTLQDIHDFFGRGGLGRGG